MTFEVSRANGFTSAAFVGMATVVLSTLYRKRQTRIDCNSWFWNEFWKYASTKDKELVNNDDETVFSHMYYCLTKDKPSDPVATFITNIIENHLKQIKSKLNKECVTFEDNTLHKYLSKHPLQILVPLCGSSYDLYYISYLLRTKYNLDSKQFKIIGIESSATAITHFFNQKQMVYNQSCYNPKLIYFADFYRIWMYSSEENGIHIIENDIFEYFELSQTLNDIGIAPTPCLIKEGSIDIIVDINAMSCCNPSDIPQYTKALKYWLSDEGSILLNAYCYDPKLSNYPPFACHQNRIGELFDTNKCLLLQSKHCNIMKSICHSWLIQK